MSKRKERQKQWQERNGVLGELNLGMLDVFFLEEVMRKLQFDTYRDFMMLKFYNGVTSNWINVNKDQIDELESKFRRLALHLRTKERERLELKAVADDARESGDYCC